MRTLGQFYREEILSLPAEDLVLVQLPLNGGDVRVEQGLFGWTLRADKNFLDCRSEEEARYLKVFLDSGMREVYIPKDDETLREILPRLERIKGKIDQILQTYLIGVLDRKVRERVRYEVLAEITQ
jgi:hypothetical protein